MRMRGWSLLLLPVLFGLAACRQSSFEPPQRSGPIGLIETGDPIIIDIPSRTLHLDVPEDVLAERLAKQQARERPWTPVDRDRPISAALRAYALMATSASDGAVRRVP